MAEISDQWIIWKELLDGGELEGLKSDPDKAIRSDWYNAKWIPITHNGSGDHHCLDFNPTEHGNIEQVIGMWHDAADRILLARSFREWLDDYVEALESGKYVYSEDYGGIVIKADI